MQPLPLTNYQKKEENHPQNDSDDDDDEKLKNRTNDQYVQCLVSLRLSSHPGDVAAEGIATKPSLAIVDLLYDVLLREAVQAVPRREPRAAAGVGL